MKRIVIILLLATISAALFAQKNENSLRMELGKGLNISMNNDEYIFNVGGYVQIEGLYNEIKDQQSETRFGIRRAYLNIGGVLFHNKLSFQTRFDFTDPYPLLDAWIAYNPIKELSISVGQRQAFSGPLSMSFDEVALAMGDRSLVDRTFFASGRELGIFIESRLPIGKAGLSLGAAVTSGDGRNSFGSSSSDYDLGGYKYTGRAAIYPFGFFSPGNDRTDTDFAREKSVKMVLGGTFSYNMGVSDRIGEGHGNMSLYDNMGNAAYPDYQKISGDLMIKYSGFTFLVEYINAIGAGLTGLYYEPQPTSQLFPKKIAEYLVLGNGLNMQLGYLLPSNWALDVRYSTVMPEWKDKIEQIEKINSYKGSISKYFIDNRLKIQGAVTYTDFLDRQLNNKQFIAEIGAHILF